MAKRHLKQSEKQRLGIYFSREADTLLAGFEHVVAGRQVLDPFAGNWDLLNWATRNGATGVSAFDLIPQNGGTVRNDSLLSPPDYRGHVVVTNPPFLNANKCRNGDKSAYGLWQQDDYYKCHLASLDPGGCDEALAILPSNFLCESRPSIRNRLFRTHHIVTAQYWSEPVFADATTGICVVHVRRGHKPDQRFKLVLRPSQQEIDVRLGSENGYLHGDDFFDFIRRF